MGVLDENGGEFETCVKVKISDRLRALQENANKWQPMKSTEELRINTLKERRKVFANENHQNRGDENKSPNFTLVAHKKPSFQQRRNQQENQPETNPFAFVKLKKRIAIAEPQKASGVDDLSFISEKRQLVIADGKNGNFEESVDGAVNKAEVEGGEVEQKPNVVVDQKLELQQCSGVLLERREQNQGMSEDDKNIAVIEEEKNEPKPSYLLATTKRSVAPPQRRVPTRFQNAVKSNNQVPTISLNSELHLETDDKENCEDGKVSVKPKLRVSSAVPFQAPVIGKEHCGVQLRHVDRSSSFPNPMLIRAISMGKQIDLRLVRPSKQSASEHGAYLLATDKELVIRNGAQATVQERSKIAQLAHEIVAGKEMFAYSGKPKLANEDGTAEAAFWRHLNEEDAVERGVVEDLQERYPKSFAFYKINDSGEAIRIECDSVTENVLDSSQVLVLDFGSEIYTWLGRNCRRSLGKYAQEFAEKLKSSPMPSEMSKFVGAINEDIRPKWVLCRRLSEGIADSLFRHKFSIDSVPRPAAISPNFKNVSTGPSKMSSKFSNNLLVCHKPTSSASNVQLKGERVLAEELAAKFAHSSPPKECALELEDMEIRPFDLNVFTEHLNFYVLNGESLETLEGQPSEFDCHKCYVVEWRYRVERGGVRKLNQSEAKKHDTGRTRGVFFYWLGQSSTVKEQSVCALALRNKDRERLEHIRLEQGHEHPVFISLFDEAGFIVSGTQSNLFLFHSYGGDGNLLAMMEMRGKWGRSQTAMVKVLDDELKCQRGHYCPQVVWDNAKILAQKLANIRQLTLSCSETLEFDNLKPLSWSNSPRFYRIYELEGDELVTNRSHFTFPAHQSDLKDGCILIENDGFLWIWSDGVVRTFELKVANNFWTVERKKDSEMEAKVICKGSEPDEFLALFPEWKRDEVEEDENQATPPQTLAALLTERTKTRSLKEVRERNLPEGCDLKNLEKYLSDEDFTEVFKLTKQEFDAQPKWKQIQLKKSANLF